MQAGEFFFLRSQFFNYTLHGCSHECGSIVGVGIRAGPIAARKARVIVQHFAHHVEKRYDAEQKYHEQRCGVPQAEGQRAGWALGNEREYQGSIHFYRTISND